MKYLDKNDYSVGYVKDCIAFVCFIISILLISKIKRIPNVKQFVKTAIYVVLCGTIVDGIFTFNPSYHNTIFGYNTPSYIVIGAILYFITVSILHIKQYKAMIR